MTRYDYQLFSAGRIGPLELPNRLVRSGTWDPSVLPDRRVNDAVVDLYRQVALGGVGLIITGDLPVVPSGMLDGSDQVRAYHYDDVGIEDISRVPEAVHNSAPDVRIVVQLSADYPGVAPSDIQSPFTTDRARPLTSAEIRTIADCFVRAIPHMKEAGFDGVQLHAAHGGLLSRFLSPFANRRTDAYGGCVENRSRIVREIVSGARKQVGTYPIMIKLNCTDYVEGGTDLDNFPALAREIERAGVDAIELSGGMWDCLVRSEAELGFRPVPSPESHTRIRRADRQSYFLPYAESVDLGIPLILVGGNRDVERMEEIVRGGRVDFLSMCRPLICEPDLPRRWLEGRGSSSADCIACNSCIYHMIVNVERGTPRVATCVFKADKRLHRTAQRWLAAWVSTNVISGPGGDRVPTRDSKAI